jgi:hypothetical protein
MGLRRGAERGEIYPGRAKSLLEPKWEQDFCRKFLKKSFDPEGHFLKLGFSTGSLLLLQIRKSQKC